MHVDARRIQKTSGVFAGRSSWLGIEGRLRHSDRIVELQIADCRFQIEIEIEIEIEIDRTLESAICNLQSAICNLIC
jgi:hypothetical protein